MSTAWKWLPAILPFCMTFVAFAGEGSNLDGYRFSEPFAHGNLAIYFIQGTSRGGPVPLTLEEALNKRILEVRETSQVNELEIENTGDEEIFIQSGDIVKGGKQDRVLSDSLVLPPHSGALPIGAFCVESGRWSQRLGEDARRFTSSQTRVPSRSARLELAGAPPTPGRPAPVGTRQQQIWNEVAQIQSKLSTNLRTPVAAPNSHTSLQLSLENARLAREHADYISALEPRGLAAEDIVGYVLAINGKVNSADIYPSNAMFQKLWPKLLRAGVTEAISEGKAEPHPAPTRDAIADFINSTGNGPAVESRAGQTIVRSRDTPTAVFTESRALAAPASGWVHRSYLAK